MIYCWVKIKMQRDGKTKFSFFEISIIPSSYFYELFSINVKMVRMIHQICSENFVRSICQHMLLWLKNTQRVMMHQAQIKRRKMNFTQTFYDF